MGLSAAERNRRKRERKKREREAQRQQEEEAKDEAKEKEEEKEVEIDYVAEPVALPQEEEAFEALRKLQERVAVTDDENNHAGEGKQDDNALALEEKDDEDHQGMLSKRQLRQRQRPSVADLKRRVPRPDLVEAHDVTAADPAFLIQIKAVPGTVPVPRHWGRKRKYLQGKRGFEKPPFKLPDFIEQTGITELRGSVAEDEGKMSAKQRNRMRVAPKMGAIDVDYRTLHDAFFKHQTKPKGLTKLGDLYYEGKELEVKTKVKAGRPLSEALRDALGMALEVSPPPWLNNMQRYGPPPSYPNLKIPGLNAPLPSAECQYGYHPGGYGKPPVDAYGRPLYGGNPFDPPGTSTSKDADDDGLVTSDGKTLVKKEWGALPTGYVEAESEEEESSEEEMEESEEEEEAAEEATVASGLESVLPPPGTISATAPVDLRKQAGDETPMSVAPKQLYQVIDQKQTSADQRAGAVFASDVAYVVPGTAATAAVPPEGAESVLSKALPANETGKRKRKTDDDEEEEADLGKNFKF